MEFLYVDEGAVNVLAANRYFQTSDFRQSEIITSFLAGEIEDKSIGELSFIKEKKGGYIVSEGTHFTKSALVFDLTTFSGFSLSSSKSKGEIITIFQKILKFSIRYWQKLPFTSCEKNIQGSNLSIVFPFSFTPENAYRVVIDRNPDEKRVKARGGSYLLVFDDSNRGSSSDPSYTVFKKALEFVPVAKPGRVEEQPNGYQSQFSVSTLEGYKSIIDPNVGFETWKYLLTDSQKDFVFKPVSGPERLEGAAGTGKTLSMILRAIFVLKDSIQSSKSSNLLFVTHSIASKRQIISIFENNFSDITTYFDRHNSAVSIEINTLQEWCISFLGQSLNENEYLDKDAQDSKILQSLYIEEAINAAYENDFPSFKNFCSENFINFIENTPTPDLIEMFQLEIAVTIKGRASDDKEKYRNIQRNHYAIPLEVDGDYNYSFLIFEKYQDSLAKTGQFDSDDITLTVLSQLNSPIWRRRRDSEGFDIIFIDETHLFNFNELSVFHHLLKNKSNSTNIVFAFDKSQAVGDRGLSDHSVRKYLSISNLDETQSDKRLLLNTVFRSSPSIINLAHNVLSSGNSLFDGFQNSLEEVGFSFTSFEEKKAKNPTYNLYENDDVIIETAFAIANAERDRLSCDRSDIAIISTTELLLHKLENYAASSKKPYELIKRRGDLTMLKTAQQHNRFVLAGIDYVGGLEFSCVLIIGVDKGRVPPTMTSEGSESYHFLNYSWHNRMYVGITRAKYSVFLLGEKARGYSKMFDKAINSGILEVK